MKVAPERSGFRDAALSARHRCWGFDCPALDIDFIMLEYDQGRPIAIVEYKLKDAAFKAPTHPTYRALIELCSLARIPFFDVRYTQAFDWWSVVPLNGLARKWLAQDTIFKSELDYVRFLYVVRGRPLPEDLFDFQGRLFVA